MAIEKETKSAEDSLSSGDVDIDKKVEDSQDDEPTKVKIQKLSIRSAATTVKADQAHIGVKILKVVFAFLVLWVFDALFYWLVITLTIQSRDTILYVYFGLFVVCATFLAFAVLYGMRTRQNALELELRREKQGLQVTLAQVGGGNYRARTAAPGRTDSLAMPSPRQPRQNSKVTFKD